MRPAHRRSWSIWCGILMGRVTPYTTASGKRYRVRYRTPDERQTDRRGFKTRREAELFLATVEVSKSRGDYIEPGAANARIHDLGTAWLANQGHLKPSSLRPVAIAWRLHVEPKWGRRRVSEISFSEVQSWVFEFAAGDGKPRSATTVSRAFGVLASILDTAVRDRRIPSNPVRGIKLPRPVTREHVYLSHQQVADLVNGAEEHAPLVLLLAYTGLRWGEAIGLRVKDVQLEERRIRVSVNAVEVGGEIQLGTPKTHKRRTVPYPRLLSQSLERQIEGKGPEELVFSDDSGDYMRRTRVSGGSRSWFKRALADAGLGPMTIHDLRHTAASLAISAGANVKAVQRMLGHASAAMTLDTYSDLFDDDLNAVSDRLDEAYEKSVVGKMWANEN
jgi:integrase